MSESTVNPVKQKPDRSNLFDYFYKYGLYIVFVGLLIFFSRFNVNFLTTNNMINLLTQTATVSIAAAGLAFVMITGGIDISVGSVLFMTSIIVAAATDAGVGLFGAFVLALASGAAIGSVNGFLIAKLKMAPLIVTLAMMFVIRGMTIWVVGIQPVFFRNDVSTFLARTRYFDMIPVIVIIMAVVLAVCQFALSKSAFGRQLFAIGNNRHASETMGIPVTRNVFLSYVICGALAGLSGLISGAQIGAIPPTFATGQEFIIISSAVLGGVSLFGGKGRAFPGIFLGVLIIMTIENGLVMAQANMYAFTIFRGMVIFIAVFLDSAMNRGAYR